MSFDSEFVAGRRTLLKASGAALGALMLGGRAPAAGAGRESFSFVVLGDTHFARETHYDFAALRDQNTISYARAMCEATRTGWDGLWEEVAAQLRALSPRPAFVLHLGDYVHGDCTSLERAAQQYRDFVDDLEGRRLPVPIYLTRGNHDLAGRGAREAYARTMPDFLARSAPSARGAAHYAFDVGDLAHVAVLDVFGTQEPAKDRPLLAADQIAWLDADLAAFRRRSPAGRIFVASHAPVFHVTSFDTVFGADPAGHAALLHLLLRHRVDAVLCGHLHAYARLRYTDPTNGHVLSQLMSYSIIGPGERREPPPAEVPYAPLRLDRRVTRSEAMLEAMRSIVGTVAPGVSGFRLAEVPGYQVVTVEADGSARVDAYQGLGRRRYESFSLPTSPARTG